MSATNPNTAAALKSIARASLEALCNEPRNFTLSRFMLADTVEIQHDSHPPTTDPDVFTTNFQEILKIIPDFHMQIKDIIAEVDESGVGGGRVWVFSRITGIQSKMQVDSVDMMTINSQGKVVKSKDVQRKLEGEESA